MDARKGEDPDGLARGVFCAAVPANGSFCKCFGFVAGPFFDNSQFSCDRILTLLVISQSVYRRFTGPVRAALREVAV